MKIVPSIPIHSHPFPAWNAPGNQQEQLEETMVFAIKHSWLVVWTPLKNMKVNWDDEIPNISGKIKLMATKPPTRWMGVLICFPISSYISKRSIEISSQMPHLPANLGLSALVQRLRRPRALESALEQLGTQGSCDSKMLIILRYQSCSYNMYIYIYNSIYICIYVYIYICTYVY